jgi:hypothetical protein
MRNATRTDASNGADYTKNSELITYEEFQIRVTNRVTVSASNKKDAGWRLALQSKNQDMAWYFR